MIKEKADIRLVLEQKLKDEFVEACGKNEVTPSAILRAYMKYYTEDKNATTKRVNRLARKDKELKKKEYRKCIKLANKAKAKIIKAGHKLRGGEEEFVTVRTSRKVWLQFSEYAREEGQFPTRLATNLVLNWLKRPVRIRRWHYKNGATVRLRLVHKEKEKFLELVGSEKIQSSMSRIVDGLMRGWVMTQRRKRNHWNVDPYKM